MRQAARLDVLGLLAGVLVVILGCSASDGSSTRTRMATLCRAGLDDCREIELTYDHLRDHEAGQPERTYEQLRIVVKPRAPLSFEQTVKTAEVKLGTPQGQCRFENVDVRRDKTGRKIWFVQRDTSRIIATLDLDTNATTGPDDEPPAWATPDGGASLPRAE